TAAPAGRRDGASIPPESHNRSAIHPLTSEAFSGLLAPTIRGGRMAQGFDPAAATAAYLATLPPAAHAKAAAYTQGGHWLLLWGTLVGILVSWIVIRSGVLVRVRSRIGAAWLAVIAVAVVDTLLESVLSIPWDAYAHWWRETSYGLTSRA